MYDFTQFKTARTFGDDIKNGAMTIDIAKDEQNELPPKVIEFNIYIKPRNSDIAKEKPDVIINTKILREEKCYIVVPRVEYFHYHINR